MTVNISKPAVNVREKLAELDKPTGIAGEAMLRAETPQEQFQLIGAGRRNLIINGAMQVAQRGTSVTGFTGGSYTTLDRFYFEANAGTYTLSQGTSGSSGFPNTFKVEATGASSTQILNLQHRIEGGSLQPLGFGTADAKELTASFWVKTNVTGTYTLELYNGDATRQVSKNYTVNSSGTWEYKTITLPADTSSGFDNDANLSLYMVWWLAAPSTHTSGTQNTSAWASASTANRVSPSIVDIGDTVGNYFEITGVQLELGKVATPFEHRSYGEELALCQRYFQKIGGQNYSPLGNGINFGTISRGVTIDYIQTMRATPSVVINPANSLVATDRTAFDNPISAVASYTPNLDRATFAFTHSQNLGSNGYPIQIAVRGGYSGFLEFDAEL